MELLALLLALSQKPGPWVKPALPDGKPYVTLSGAELLAPPEGLQKGVVVAKTAPEVHLLYLPGQDYPGKPWSIWGESTFVAGKFFTAIGDHLAPAGNAFVYEYDPEKKAALLVADVAKALALPEGHYVPGKIHSKLSLGSDGWLYFATHRGSTRTTTDAHKYRGDWVLRYHPGEKKTEVVLHAPVPKHCIPVSALDPKRMLFYGSTQPGDNKGNPHFFVLDLKARKVLLDSDDGPARAIAVSPSMGRAYFTRKSDDRLMRYDAASNKLEALEGSIGLRAASDERDGALYTVSQGRKGEGSAVYAFDVKSEKAREVGPAAVGSQEYITALALSPDGRFLYYAPGAHGGAARDGTPVVQMDVKSGRRKALCFLARACAKHGVTPVGTYGLALDDKGERLFITWNASRGVKNWDVCCLTAITIPAKERE
jgi:sugar lactone lactonase YvrE